MDNVRLDFPIVTARHPTDDHAATPGTVGPFDSFVAARGFGASSVVTSPNSNWVPRFAIARSEITTYTDGRWGMHEYLRWPQAFACDLFHIHCIPAHPRPLGPGEICWHMFGHNDWRVDHCGITDVGVLDAHLHILLAGEARAAIMEYERIEHGDSAWMSNGDFLIVCLRHAIDRLHLIPVAPSIIVCLAGHVQRLTLELYGMI